MSPPAIPDGPHVDVVPPRDQVDVLPRREHVRAIEQCREPVEALFAPRRLLVVGALAVFGAEEQSVADVVGDALADVNLGRRVGAEEIFDLVTEGGALGETARVEVGFEGDGPVIVAGEERAVVARARIGLRFRRGEFALEAVELVRVARRERFRTRAAGDSHHDAHEFVARKRPILRQRAEPEGFEALNGSVAPILEWNALVPHRAHGDRRG